MNKIYLTLGAILGFVSWGNNIAFTILSPLIFLAYLRLSKRQNLFFFMFGYYLLSSRGLLLGTITYYKDISYGFIVWLGVAFLVSIAWIIIWSPKSLKRYFLFPLALLVQILPPVGFISWVNPLPSAGLILPGFGYFGMVLLISFIYLISIIIDKTRYDNYIPIKLFASLVILIFLAFAITKLQTKQNMDFKTVETNFKYEPEKIDRVKDYMRISRYFNIANSGEQNITLLPENALGFYSESQRVVIWNELNTSKKVYAGAYIVVPNKNKFLYDNVLLFIDHNSTKIIYKQRVPVLVSMWRPFSSKGARATIYKDPIVFIEGKNTGVFICYEQLLTYTFLQTMFYKPERLLAISNLYWAKDTNIEQIQRETLELYGLLFDIPIYYSVNR